MFSLDIYLQELAIVSGAGFCMWLLSFYKRNVVGRLRSYM
jgi:hypothetical protein